MAEDLNVYPIKIDSDKLNEYDMGETLPSLPFFMLMCGKVRSGKTLCYNNLSLSNRFYGDKFETKVLISPTAHQDANNTHLLEEFDFVFDTCSEEIIQSLLDEITTQEDDGRWLIIFDDVIGSLKQNKNGKPDLVTSLSTKYRHIANANNKEGMLSVIVCSQYFNFFTPTLRDNASCYLILGVFSDDELKKMGKVLSVFGGNIRSFIELYHMARTEDRWDFLYLNIRKLQAWRSFKTLLWDEDGFKR